MESPILHVLASELDHVRSALPGAEQQRERQIRSCAERMGLNEPLHVRHLPGRVTLRVVRLQPLDRRSWVLLGELAWDRPNEQSEQRFAPSVRRLGRSEE